MSSPPTPPPTAARDLSVVRQYQLLVYAFHHPFANVDSAEVHARLDGRWEHWWKRLSDRSNLDSGEEGLSEALDDTYFFLPHVRELLFPETASVARGAAAEQLRDALNLLSGNVPLAARLPASAVRWYTLREESKRPLAPSRLHCQTPHENFGADFTLDWIDLALFPQSVGFLIFKVAVQPDQNRPLTTGLLNDFLYYARILQPLHVGWTLARWQLGTGEEAAECEGAALIDFLLQEVSGAARHRPPAVRTGLKDYLLVRNGTDNPSSPRRYTTTDFGQTYGDGFHIFSYAALAETAPVPGIGSPPTGGAFDGEIERALYEATLLIDTNAPAFRPHPSAVEAWRKENCVRLWENWQAVLHPDHTIFLGLGESAWTCQRLPHIVLNDYFKLYLLVLFQKIAVSFLFPEVSRREKNLSHNLRGARALWASFLDFQSRYWLTEVTQRVQGKTLYAGFQKALDVKTVYDELRAEVEDVQKFYEARFQRQISALTTFLTVVGLPLGLFAGMFGTSVLSKAPKAAWKLWALHRWPQTGNNLETDKANAVVWLLVLLFPGMIYGLARAVRWLRRKDARRPLGIPPG